MNKPMPTAIIKPASEETIAEAIKALSMGALVGVPTETVYGLAADGTNAAAVAAIYQAKGRPSNNPLIAHVADKAAAEALAHFTPEAHALADAFWPGPLTLVLEAREPCSLAPAVRAGHTTLAVRVPYHPVMQALLQGFAKPIVAPSANLSGHISPTTAQHVFDDLAASLTLIVDGGRCEVGLESTIVLSTKGEEVRLLRPGLLTKEVLSLVLQKPLAEPATATSTAGADGEFLLLAPGMMHSHYAPKAAVRLDAQDVREGEALLAFGHALIEGAEQAVRTFNLSKSSSSREAAHHLYAALRYLDGPDIRAIAVMPLPLDPIGLALQDRIRRAAAEKST
jgi:L-threonylcarbamoyladenylate synthase